MPVPARYWAVSTVWLGITMAVLDSSVANVALPTISQDLATSPAEAIWIVSAYQLTIAMSLLPLAALGGVLGFRRIYLGGLAAFTIASLGCSLAHTLPELVIARALQGFGAAGLMSVNGTLLRFAYPAAQLGRGVGLNALVVSVAAVVGPSVASGILAVGPWEWLFAINVPIGIFALLVGRVALPSSPTGGTLDKISTLLNMLTFGLFFTGADLLTHGGGGWVGAAELVGGTVAGTLLVLRSRGQERPLAPIDLLRSRLFSLSVATSIASFAAQTLAFLAIPFYLQGALHRTQVETGLLITPWPCAVGFSAPIAGRLADRFPAAILSFVGLGALGLGLLLLGLMPADVSSFDIGWRMAICGAGFGFFQAPNNRTLLSSVPLSRTGAAGGMLATSRLTGQTIGAIVTAVCFRIATDAETTALMIATGFACFAAIASLSRLSAQPMVQWREPGPGEDAS